MFDGSSDLDYYIYPRANSAPNYKYLFYIYLSGADYVSCKAERRLAEYGAMPMLPCNVRYSRWQRNLSPATMVSSLPRDAGDPRLCRGTVTLPWDRSRFAGIRLWNAPVPAC